MKSTMAWHPQNEDFFHPTAAIEANGLTHQQILSNREALERKLQLRRPREQLINQGIMPAAMAAPSILSQKSKLERAQTGDLLQRKIRVRPNRAQLIQRHILNDTSAGVDPSLIANQIKLKRKKLADDLNDKLLARPGPLELVKENILEVGTPVGQAVLDGEVDYTETADSAFLQPVSPDSEGSPIPSPDTMGQLPLTTSIKVCDTSRHNNVLSAVSQLHQLTEGTTCPYSDGQSFKKEPRPRKKQSKPKFKKYKYHEYRPPNGEVEKSSLPMDSPYALMLQQQQLYLQLQVLYQNYPYQFPGLPSIPENMAKNANLMNNNDLEKPVKIEDMRVVDMRKELKMRGLPVSGSKTDLIERLRASSAEAVLSPDMLFANSPGSPTIMVSANSATSAPVTMSMSAPVFSKNGHNQLVRSNSLPVDKSIQEMHVKQVQMQLMANTQKLQQHPCLPAELQQQLQQLQYLNLQMQLQRLNVQPGQQPGQPPGQQGVVQQKMQDNTGCGPQSFMLGTQQLSPTSVTIKQEQQIPDACAFGQQQSPQNDLVQFSNASYANTAVTQQAPQVSMAQMNSQQFNGSNQQNPLSSRSLDDMSFLSHGNSQTSGLLLLQAEANRLDSSPSHSEQDLSQLDGSEFSWGKGSSQGSPSPTGVFITTTQADNMQARTMDPANYVKPKLEQPMQRSYSNSERSPEEGNGLIQGITLEVKPRSNSEPPQPFAHKRSCSLPSTAFFQVDHVQPPPSYEAHMAAQYQRKLSHDYTQPQQPAVKTEDMDISMDKEQEITQELQRAMLKQEVGLDHDEILEILGAPMAHPQDLKVPNSMGNQIPLGTIVNTRPHNLSPNQHLYHNGLPIPKSPSTGFLGFHVSPANQFSGRLSKSCEDVAGVNNMSNKNSLQSEGSFPDLDSIMSPGSPMKMDSDSDYTGLVMHSTHSIPIPGSKHESLGWLDLNNSPIITSTSPGLSTDVTYSNRGTPPQSLYATSPSLTSEHFPLSLFELDGTGGHTLPNDFSEAMDFCV